MTFQPRPVVVIMISLEMGRKRTNFHAGGLESKKNLFILYTDAPCALFGPDRSLSFICVLQFLHQPIHPITTKCCIYAERCAMHISVRGGRSRDHVLIRHWPRSLLSEFFEMDRTSLISPNQEVPRLPYSVISFRDQHLLPEQL